MAFRLGGNSGRPGSRCEMRSASNLHLGRPMKSHTDTGMKDRDEWRDRIVRALQELRSDDASIVTRGRHADARDDSGGASAKM